MAADATPPRSPRSRTRSSGVGYLADEPAALVSYLAQRLGKPVLVEGPAGVGKTELAKALSRATGRELIRLQCYEGLDEAKALYEWNYRKQLLRIQAERRATSWSDVRRRHLLRGVPAHPAAAAGDRQPTEPVVLLIDEIDKTDQEFEAMLLEVLSDFQISIPELGRIEARTHPIVVLTSNNSRELTEALKRRCLYLWLDYPEVEREMEIVRLHAPELDEALARRLVEVIHMVRAARPEEAALDRRVDRLGAGAAAAGRRRHRPRRLFEQTMSIIVKHRTDIDLVAERVGVKLGQERQARPGQRRLTARRCRRASPRGCSRFCEELRGEGVAVGTSEILDAFAALETVPWTDAGRLPRGAGGDDRQVAGGPPRLRAALRPLLLPRRRGGGARARGSASEGRRYDGRRAARPRRAARGDPPGDRRGRRRRDARPGAAGDRRLRPPGRGLRRGRRRRAADPPHARPARPAAADRGRRRRAAADRPRAAQPLRAPPAPRARARR